MTSFRKKVANFFYAIGGAFESAIVSPSRGNPNTINPSDAKIELPAYTRTELVRKARYLEKNSGDIRGILRDLKVYGIGKEFIQAQSQITTNGIKRPKTSFSVGQGIATSQTAILGASAKR